MHHPNSATRDTTLCGLLSARGRRERMAPRVRGPRTVGEVPAAVAQPRPQRAGHVAARRVQRLQAVQQRGRACAGRARRSGAPRPAACSLSWGWHGVRAVPDPRWAGRPAPLSPQAFGDTDNCSMTKSQTVFRHVTLSCTCRTRAQRPAHRRWACRPASWPARWAASSAAPHSRPARAPASRGAAR